MLIRKFILVELKNRLRTQQDNAIMEETEPEGSGKLLILLFS
jgi:hypothetical protein